MIAKRGWTREKERKRRCRRINREDKWEDNAYLFYKMPKAIPHRKVGAILPEVI